MISAFDQKISVPRRLQEIHSETSSAIGEFDLKLLQKPENALEQSDICCDAPNIREDMGYFVCINCGMVHDVVIDTTPRRAFTAEEVRNRKGSEPVYSIIGPRTLIRGSRDAKGSQLNGEQKLKFSRLAKIHRSLTTSYERNLYVALPSLDRFQEQLGLPDIVTEDALRIYTQAVREKLTLGRTNDAILGASILSAVRIHDVPRSLKEILDTTGLDRKKTIRAFRLIMQRILPKFNLKVQHFTPVRYVDKFFEELGSSMNIRNEAIDLLKRCMKKGLPVAGKDPRGLAAAAIYLAGMKFAEKKTQNEIATTLRITEVTLRNRIKEIKRCDKAF